MIYTVVRGQYFSSYMHIDFPVAESLFFMALYCMNFVCTSIY